MRGQAWVPWARYGLPGMLLGLALAWMSSGRIDPIAQAQTPGQPTPRATNSPISPGMPRGGSVSQGESNGLITMRTTNAQDGSEWLYLIDTREQVFAIYRMEPTDRGLIKLIGVRKYSWDLKVTEWNNLPPDVNAIQAAVTSQGAGANR